MKVTANVLLRNPTSGEVVFVAEGADAPSWAHKLIGPHLRDGDGDEAPADSPYLGWKVPALKDEIASRNAARERAGLDALPVTGRKPALAAALVEDDATDYDREVDVDGEADEDEPETGDEGPDEPPESEDG